jgi:hypothetical protein
VAGGGGGSATDPLCARALRLKAAQPLAADPLACGSKRLIRSVRLGAAHPLSAAQDPKAAHPLLAVCGSERLIR